jgi:CheY-like chemotaxis protein
MFVILVYAFCNAQSHALGLSPAWQGCCPDIPVIVTTGYGSPENERLARAKGAVAYIRKPFKFEELTGAISTFLK